MACCCKQYWKQSSSIDNLTRKKIWEENYKIRESLKEIQQSEHFWSFQMTSGGCCGSSPPTNKTRRFASLQNLNEIVPPGPQCEAVNHRSKFVFPTACQQHKSAISGSPSRYRRDVGTETLPMCFDKSVGPEHRIKQVRVPSYSEEMAPTPFQSCSRYKPPNWGRNDVTAAKQYRQQSLQKLRKNEEALRQSIQRSKKGLANPGRWGTEYSRSFKDGLWSRPMDNVPRSTFQSRAGTPMPNSILGRNTPLIGGFRGADTPLPRHAAG